MKKFTRVLCILMCVAATLALFGCADSGAPNYKKSDPSTFAVSVESVVQKLDGFMQGRSDRTSYTEAEKSAAEYLRDTLVGYGYADGPATDGSDGGEGSLPSLPTEDDSASSLGMIREFSVNDEGGLKLISRNVVAVYNADSASGKNVVIGAYYDNFYSTPYAESKRKGTKSAGALSNGSGVAALLAIAEYLQTEKPALDYSVTLAFFGASSVNNAGVKSFYDKMTASEKRGTVLMIELQRLGVDHVYAFSDARETKREPFFDGIAAENGLDIYKVTQKSPVITDVSGLNGIPYFQWAMYGNFGVFFNHNIPTLNIVGANWETLDLTDRESSDNDDMEFTERDTLSNLKKYYPDYGEKIASAATLVVKSLEDPAFLETMEYDLENFPDTDYLNKNWIWYLVVLGIALIAGGIMMLLTSRLAKKYPPVPPQPRKMKMAVFGMDYEDKNSADIFVDIRQPEPMDDIFPGVPNNDGSANVDPFGCAPPRETLAPHTDVGTPFEPSVPTEQNEVKEREEPVNTSVDAVPAEEETQAGEKAEEEKSEIDNGSAEDSATDGNSQDNVVPEPTEKKPTAPTAPKRRAPKTSASAAPKKRAPAAKKSIKTESADSAEEDK